MILEARLEQSFVNALGLVLGDLDGIQVVGARLEDKIEQADKRTIVAVASGLRAHDAFSLSLVNVPVAISVVTRAEGDANSALHNEVLELIMDKLTEWHRDGATMQRALSSRQFLAGELRMDGGPSQVYDKERSVWYDTISTNIRGSEKILDPNITAFYFADFTFEEYDITGTLNRTWMNENGIRQGGTWVKPVARVEIGNHVTEITQGAFDQSQTLKEVEIGDNVTSIVSGFVACVNLTDLTLGDSITTLGNSSFA